MEVQAVVTSLFEDNDALDGFFLQEEDADSDGDPATSEGLFVFCRGNCPVGLAVGDLVTVTGVVAEFFQMTQIDAENGSIVVDSNGNALPAATAVTLPADGPTNGEPPLSRWRAWWSASNTSWWSANTSSWPVTASWS